MMISVLFAYGLIWLIIFGYMLFVQRKQVTLERELEMVREMMEK